MAIFDSEKRPRGLRVPSLAAMKNGGAASISQFSFHSKSADSRTPDEALTTGPAFDPALPPKAGPPGPPPKKELPAIPKDQLPPPPRMSSTVPSRREVGSTASASANSASAPQGLRRAAAPPAIEIASPVIEAPSQSQLAPAPPAQAASVPSPASATLTPPVAADGDAMTPLEDFIPTPDANGTPLEYVTSEEQTALYTPLDFDPVPAPLNKLHFACFQEHRNMPVAKNVWCPVPCMTCHKFDEEIRYRCVFCCLRICEGCHQALVKCKDRSLAELMAILDRA